MTGFASRPWLIVPVVAAMHITYASGVFYDPDVAHITALHFAHELFDLAMPYVLLAVAVAAITPMLAPFRMRPVSVHLFLWPQQFMLFLMALSAVVAAWNGAYPDGTERSFAFIMADQCYSLFLALGHLAATVRNARYQ